MTTEELIAEGRRLERPCNFLRPTGSGEVAAVWHPQAAGKSTRAAFRPWLSVDTRFIPGFDTTAARFVTILTNEEDYVSGRIDVAPALPAGMPLYAHAASVLPPIDAVFACGSAAVEQWLHANNWKRDVRYNENFAEKAVVAGYERVWMEEFPLYFSGTDIYAVLGGWHWPNADDDWHALIQKHLLAMTIRDSEPWVEAWQSATGEYQVIQ